MGVSPGNDTRYSQEKTESARNFANKIWNASRFVLMNIETGESLGGKEFDMADKWILTRYFEAVRDISGHMEEGDLGLAAQKIYDFSWSEFCDWYIELVKSRLQGDNAKSKATARAVLLYVLEGVLKLLHPFMPFVTEAIYGYLPDREGFLMLAGWPEPEAAYHFPHDAARMQGVMELITRIRNLRAEMSIAPGRKTRIMLIPAPGYQDTLGKAAGFFERLAWANHVTVYADSTYINEKTVSAVCTAGELHIPLGDLVDFRKEAERLEKEYCAMEYEIARSQSKLHNKGFLEKAAPSLVEKERLKLAENRQMLERLSRRLAEVKDEIK
jgi:valyl-tRNA synthetase